MTTQNHGCKQGAFGLTAFLVIQVSIRNANVYDSRFNKGLYIKYKPYQETEFTTTKTVKDTLSPDFDAKDAKVFHYDVVKQELLDWFDSGCITFQLMGRQEDSDPDATRTRMTTKVTWVTLPPEAEQTISWLVTYCQDYVTHQ